MQFTGYEPIAHIRLFQPNKTSLSNAFVVSLKTCNNVDFIAL